MIISSWLTTVSNRIRNASARRRLSRRFKGNRFTQQASPNVRQAPAAFGRLSSSIRKAVWQTFDASPRWTSDSRRFQRQAWNTSDIAEMTERLEDRTLLSAIPAFGAAQLNPFGLADIGGESAPSLGDVDGDGDLDVLAGDNTGNFRLFENTGTATAPAFGAAQLNPFGLADIGIYSAPSLGDVDGDGDLDVLAGDYFGDFRLFENTGTATAPAFGAAQLNPFGLADIGNISTPTLGDVDGDGDLDVLAGDYFGDFRLFENTGTATAPAFGAAQLNPFGLADIGDVSTPTLGDVDGDGDLDVLAGDYFGDFRLFENTGTATAPAFGAAQLNPFGLADIGSLSAPTLGDVDGDGDLDVLAGD